MHKDRTIPPGLIPALITAALLAIPLVAMRYTTEVQWDGSDFVIMGVLLFGSGLALEWFLRSGQSRLYRLAAVVAVGSTLLMTWANMAVGLLAGESHPRNAWLLTVTALAVIGSALARLRPRGMAWTLLAMAVLHTALTIAALVGGWRPMRLGTVDVWGPNGLFILMFLCAAVLFSAAAGEGGKGAAAPAGGARRLLQALALVAIGAAVAAGGIYVGALDDAPGAGLIGLLAFAVSGVTAWRVYRSP